jgi:hypothetical protein
MQIYSIATMNDIDADFSEFTPNADLEAIRQEHEPFLSKLEALAVQAIASGNWTPVLEHLNEIMAWQDGKLLRCPKAKGQR